MTRLFGWTLAGMVALGATAAEAASIDISDYDNRTTLLTVEGSVFYDGLSDLFVASDGDLTISVDSFLTTDPLNAALDYSALPEILSPAAAVAVMEEVVEFLFVNGATGYLLIVDATGTGVDFTAPGFFIDADAQLTLDELSDNAAVIPLPASLPLALGGLAGLAFISLRRRRA